MKQENYIHKDTYINYSAGIQLRKPLDWHFLGVEEYKEALKEWVLNTPELNRRKEIFTNYPLVILSKHPYDYEGVNSTCELSIKNISKIKHKSVTEIWELIIPFMKEGFQDFELVKTPHDIVISNKIASQIIISITFITVNGPQGTVQSRMIIWKKDNYLYKLTFSYPDNQSKDILSEIENIINDIKILN